jgi:hypothetical protein
MKIHQSTKLADRGKFIINTEYSISFTTIEKLKSKEVKSQSDQKHSYNRMLRNTRSKNVESKAMKVKVPGGQKVLEYL